jgi:transposase
VVDLRSGYALSSVRHRRPHSHPDCRARRILIVALHYNPRPAQPRLIEPYEDYLRARITAWPDLSGKRLLRELKERGYTGCYSVITDFLRDARPPRAQVFERRFETAAGKQCTAPGS